MELDSPDRAREEVTGLATQWSDKVGRLTVQQIVWYLEERLSFITEVDLEKGTLSLDGDTVIDLQEGENIVMDAIIVDVFEENVG